MTKSAMIVMTDGFEDIEAIAPLDVLNRAGLAVQVVSLRGGTLKAAYGTTIVPHTTIDVLEGLHDAIIFPGGKANAERLARDPRVLELVHKHNNAGKLVAAICASPSHVLAEGARILRGRRATGDPTFNEKLAACGAQVTEEAVTVDGNIITGMGPGAALLFALQLAEYLVSRDIADGLARKWRMQR